MGHSNVRIKVRRRKVANLAANSRKYSVKNINKTISPKIDHKIIYGDLSNAITCPFTGHKFVPVDPHPIPTKYGVCITGYNWVEPKRKLWAIPSGGFKQPKCLRKKYAKKYFFKGTNTIRKVVEHPSDYTAFKKYPYTLPKMNQIEYAEKLVQHKLARWERKHPIPIKSDDTQQDMFEKEFMIPWKAAKALAEERFRDFVVSLYNKLPLIGRFEIKKDGMADYENELVAKIADKQGEGHHINDLNPKSSKLLKKAQEITDLVHAKRSNLVATNLRNHKNTKGRIILPKAA